MNNFLIGCLVFCFMCFNITSLVAKNRKLAPSREFQGDCTKTITVGSKEEKITCDSTVINVIFPDGNVSFQFNSIEKIGSRKEAITFVGKKIGVAPNTAKNVRILVVDEIHYILEPNNILETRSVNGSFCAMQFQNEAKIDFNELIKVMCFYQEGSTSTDYNLANANVSVRLHNN